jgi:type II secretory pathway predicted ATPase ExeA
MSYAGGDRKALVDGEAMAAHDSRTAEEWRGRSAPALTDLQRLAANPNAHLGILGLHSNPFPVAPDAENFFLPRHLDELVAELLLAVHSRKGFILLTGEVGLGKTTISRHLINILDGQKVDVALIVHTLIQPIELVQAINRDFGLPEVGDGVQSAISQLNQFLLERYAQGRNSVILVDDAQNLSESALEALRMISNLETGSEKLVQIILIGQPELREQLENTSLRQLRSRIAIRLYVRPLNALELRQYIQFRIESASAGPARISLTRPAFEMVQAATGGSPRLINILMDRALHGLASENRREIGDQLIADAIHELDLMPLPYKYRKAKQQQKRPFSFARVISAVAIIAATGALVLTISQTNILEPMLPGSAFTAPQVQELPQTQAQLQPQATAAPSQLQPQVPAAPSQLQPQATAAPSQLQPQVPAAPSQLPPQATAAPSQLQPQVPAAPVQLPPQAAAAPSQLQPQVPAAPSQLQTQPPVLPPVDNPSRAAADPVSVVSQDSSQVPEAVQPSVPAPLQDRLREWLAPFGFERYAAAMATALERGDINAIRQQLWTDTGVRMLLSDELAASRWETTMPRFIPDAAQPNRQLGLWEPTWWVSVEDFATRSDNVIALQSALRTAGAYTGGVDGLAGPMTQRAITRFQERENLPQTGIPDEGTLYRLQNL